MKHLLSWSNLQTPCYLRPVTIQAYTQSLHILKEGPGRKLGPINAVRVWIELSEQEVGHAQEGSLFLLAILNVFIRRDRKAHNNRLETFASGKVVFGTLPDFLDQTEAESFLHQREIRSGLNKPLYRNRVNIVREKTKVLEIGAYLEFFETHRVVSMVSIRKDRGGQRSDIPRNKEDMFLTATGYDLSAPPRQWLLLLQPEPKPSSSQHIRCRPHL
jgi:hypothetical protein